MFFYAILFSFQLLLTGRPISRCLMHLDPLLHSNLCAHTCWHSQTCNNLKATCMLHKHEKNIPFFCHFDSLLLWNSQFFLSKNFLLVFVFLLCICVKIMCVQNVLVTLVVIYSLIFYFLFLRHWVFTILLVESEIGISPHGNSKYKHQTNDLNLPQWKLQLVSPILQFQSPKLQCCKW